MLRIAALASGGGNQNNMAASGFYRPLAIFRWRGPAEHLGGPSLDEAKCRVEIHGERAPPSSGIHSGNGAIGRPDAVIHDEAVEIAKRAQSAGDEGLAIFRGGKFLLDCAAEGWASALVDQR